MKLGDTVIFKKGSIQALAQIIMIDTADGSYTVSVAGLGQTVFVPADKIAEQLEKIS